MGDPLFTQRASQKQDRTAPIQLPYYHPGSIWDYEQAFDGICWLPVIGARCPICGRWWCWREISAYERTVIELFPYRKGIIPVARFQCRATGRTFSMLPWVLAPYHQYTIESMLGLLLVVHGSDRGVAVTVIDELPSDSDVSPWLVSCWIRMALTGLHRAHGELARFYALDDLCTDGGLPEVAGYCTALSTRDPPPVEISGAMRISWDHAGMPLVGTPSQYRCGR